MEGVAGEEVVRRSCRPWTPGAGASKAARRGWRRWLEHAAAEEAEDLLSSPRKILLSQSQKD